MALNLHFVLHIHIKNRKSEKSFLHKITLKIDCRRESRVKFFLISSRFLFFFFIFTFDFYSIDFSFIAAFFIISYYFRIMNLFSFRFIFPCKRNVGSENLRLKFIVLLNAVKVELKAFDHVFVVKLKVYYLNVVVTLKIYSIFLKCKCLIFLNNKVFGGHSHFECKNNFLIHNKIIPEVSSCT